MIKAANGTTVVSAGPEKQLVIRSVGVDFGQQSAVNCWTQQVNKYVELSSSASGRCHNGRALCLI
jgi:hypothetical protein